MLLSSASRLLTFVLAAVLWSRSPHFTLTQLWYLSVATVSLQAVTSRVLLLRELCRKLDAPPVTVTAAGAAAPIGPGWDWG